MSDTREALARLLSDHGALSLSDGVACMGCDEVFARVVDHDRHHAALIFAEFLVVPRSDIVGTEYGLRYSEPGEEPTVMEDCRSGAAASLVRSVRRRQAANGLEPNAEFLSRPVLPWTPIPLPEESAL